METLYTGRINNFLSLRNSSGTPLEEIWEAQWGAQGSLIALSVVLGSSISLVGLAFAFITYSLFSDLHSLAGTTLLSFLASLFMAQLLFVIGIGGIQDSELCLSLTLALLFMKLASLCWLCCCCHHALTMFRNRVNLISTPEQKMCRMLANYSMMAWGIPLLMVGVAVAFKYKEREIKTKLHLSITEIVQDLIVSKHCWLLEGKGYICAYMIPTIILTLLGFHFVYQARSVAKLSAHMQIDLKSRNKIMKIRKLQSMLFIKILFLFTIINILGTLAALWRVNKFWAAYSILQGIQGLVTAILVTCNCRILKLYTSTKRRKVKKEFYNFLHDGEGGQYGVLTVTNPSYEENQFDNQENDLTSSHVIYKEESFVERKSTKKNISNITGQNNDIISSLAVTEISSIPLPETV